MAFSDTIIPKSLCLLAILVVTIYVMGKLVRQSCDYSPCHGHSPSTGDLVPRIRYQPDGDHEDIAENPNGTVHPHEYNTTVDFRIIIMTFNRPQALQKQLQTIGDLQTDGAQVALDIWIDVDNHGVPDSKTLQVANMYNFSLGLKVVHVQPQKAGIFGQWVNTWRPKSHTRELAVLLEDDIFLSPYAWRWLKLVHSKYKDWDRNAGYSLQCGAETLMGPRRVITTGLTPDDVIYGYRGMGTWGFAPHPEKWREFQDWLRNVKDDRFFKPYVDGLIGTAWYKSFEQRTFESSMWEMWHICYTHFNNLLTIYSNLTPQNISKGSGGSCFSVHTREAGLHYSQGAALNVDTAKTSLLLTWSDRFEFIPKKMKLFHYNGDIM